MLLFNRRSLLAVLVALPLAGCQFQPVYGPGGSGEIIRNQIRVADPTSRIEFGLIARLEDRLGSGSAYDLDYTLATSRRNVVVDGAENIDRINLSGTLEFTVRDAASGIVVQSGSVTTFTAYAATASPVATEAARRDARDRLAVALADQLVTRLIAGAQSW